VTGIIFKKGIVMMMENAWIIPLFPLLSFLILLLFGKRLKDASAYVGHKATKKDVRQSAKRRDRNRYYGKTTRNAIRDLRALEDKAAAGEQMPEVISMIDKLAKRGVIHKNKASNLKSKLTKRIGKLA
jgi:small subunit ribosomal protein S20